jgi:hypothetical protein
VSWEAKEALKISVQLKSTYRIWRTSPMFGHATPPAKTKDIGVDSDKQRARDPAATAGHPTIIVCIVSLRFDKTIKCENVAGTSTPELLISQLLIEQPVRTAENSLSVPFNKIACGSSDWIDWHPAEVKVITATAVNNPIFISPILSEACLCIGCTKMD